MESPFAVDVLMHFMEAYRPSSTGHLIGRVIPSSRRHVFRKERPIVAGEIVRPGCELWILHPQGSPMPAVAPANLQVLLLDGTWVQSNDMSRAVASLGHRVCLPMTGESRYWLRAQAGAGKFSTIESLLFLYAALGYRDAERTLRLQFELQVYATLLARGHKRRAAEYMKDSPIAVAMPAVVAAL
jgi:DTW domain-containing protein